MILIGKDELLAGASHARLGRCADTGNLLILADDLGYQASEETALRPQVIPVCGCHRPLRLSQAEQPKARVITSPVLAHEHPVARQVVAAAAALNKYEKRVKIIW
jgi:hypothetical protein